MTQGWDDYVAQYKSASPIAQTEQWSRLSDDQRKYLEEHYSLSPPPSGMNPILTMKGTQDTIEVFEDKIAITPKGVIGVLSKGLKGTKTIPFLSITAIQHKKAGAFTNGYLQFTVAGGNESRGGVFAAQKDENTFLFLSKHNQTALEIKDYIEKQQQALRTPQTKVEKSSLSDELQKLADLKASGVLSEEEFQAAKAKVMKS